MSAEKHEYDFEAEADRLIAESLDDPECFKHFLRQAAWMGEDTAPLRKEVMADAERMTSNRRRRIIKDLCR
ncbi:MAG: hypothetical protein V1738_03180 [Patescibacteria group bacterium]